MTQGQAQHMIEEANTRELEHMMRCTQKGCARCADETPPAKRVIRHLRAERAA